MKAAARIQEIFAPAAEWEPPAQCEKYLVEACLGDPELRRETESVLRAGEQADDFYVRTMPRPPTHFQSSVIGRASLGCAILGDKVLCNFVISRFGIWRWGSPEPNPNRTRGCGACNLQLRLRSVPEGFRIRKSGIVWSDTREMFFD